MSDIVTSGSLDAEGASVPLGVALNRLRRASGMTGAQLGQNAGMSQAKISKIETGAVLPTPQDVERLARELGAPDELVRRLIDQAEGSQNQMTDWRLRRGRLTEAQREVARIEKSSTTFHHFHPAIVSGLLQTTGYARAVLAVILNEMYDDRSDSESHETVAAAVTARIQRQEVLSDPNKEFVFVMPETALLHLVCHPADMPAQIQRIREVSRQENVSIKLIPSSTRLAYPPFHGFSIFDDRLVLIDIVNTSITSRGSSDVRTYQRVFDALERQATSDINPILDRYLKLYLDLAGSTTDE
jgi:transcriptional regulator with XRE-family HTH domain